MNRVLSVSALILSVAALALVAVRPSRPSLPSSFDDAPRAAAPEPDVEAAFIALRLEALEDRFTSLSRRLTELERGTRRQDGAVPSAGGQAGAPAALADELRQLRADLNAVASTEALHSDRGRELLKDAVRSVQSEVQEDRLRELRDRQQTARTERMQRFVQEARLTGTQEQTLRTLLDDEAAKRDALMGRMRGAERNRGAFNELRALREASDAQARSLLSPDQFEKYSSMRDEELRMPGRGGRGGGGGGRMREATSGERGR